MTIERKIKILLAYAGISQAELARRLGTSPPNLNQRIKRGTLSVKDMQSIADAVGCEWQADFVFNDGTRI